MKRWLVTILFAVLGTAAHALPTVANVEAEVQKGNYARAQSMMHEVVIAKPGSAKAHYIYAEILAHNDKFSDAAQEAALAKLLDSSLKFTNPDKFKAFEQLLEHEQQRASRTSRSGSSLSNLGPGSSVSPTVAAQALHRSEEQNPGMPAWVFECGQQNRWPDVQVCRWLDGEPRGGTVDEGVASLPMIRTALRRRDMARRAD